MADTYPLYASPAGKYFQATYMDEEHMGLYPAEYAGMAANGILYQGTDSEYDDDYADFDGVLAGLSDDDSDSDDILGQAIAWDLSLQPGYDREKEDSKHRMGDLLATAYTVYMEMKSGTGLGKDPKFRSLQTSAKGMTFYKWLDSVPEFQRVALISGDPLMRKGRGNLLPSMVVAFIKGVAYLDAAARKSYKLKFRAGVIEQNGELFSTVGLQTVFSGQGFAIWVMSPNDKFYSASHVKGRFHHSSFLAGGDVGCGGELIVENGKLKLLSGKSGHYQPPKENVLRAIGTLRDKGIPPESYRVVVWKNFSDPPVMPCPTAAEFLANSAGFETWGRAAKLPRTAWDI